MILVIKDGSTMIFIANNFEIYLKEEVFLQLLKFEQTIDKRESGGILLGNIYDNKMVIDKITTPKWFDISSFYSFVRNKLGHQQIIKKEWRESVGSRVYLGEWHTHSEFFPNPSDRDKKLINEIGQYKNVNYPVVMMILGLNGNIWMGVNKQGRILIAKRYKVNLCN